MLDDPLDTMEIMKTISFLPKPLTDRVFYRKRNLCVVIETMRGESRILGIRIHRDAVDPYGEVRDRRKTKKQHYVQVVREEKAYI